MHKTGETWHQKLKIYKKMQNFAIKSTIRQFKINTPTPIHTKRHLSFLNKHSYIPYHGNLVKKYFTKQIPPNTQQYSWKIFLHFLVTSNQYYPALYTTHHNYPVYKKVVNFNMFFKKAEKVEIKKIYPPTRKQNI